MSLRQNLLLSFSSSVAPTVPKTVLVLVCVCIAVLGTSEAFGQGPVTRLAENDPAPPLLKFIPSETRAQLSGEKDFKSRTRLSLNLADARLARAEAETQAERYDEAGIELGVYQALVADAVQFLQKQGRRDNKIRDNFKRIDLALREHTPRIEKIRRTTPAQSAIHIQAAIEFVRQSRTDALESFYGDTVLREKPLPPESQRAGSVPGDPEKKPQRR